MSARAEVLPIPVVVLPAAERLALAALGLAVVVTAAGPIFVRWSEVGPTATAFYRFALALPVFWLRSGAAGQITAPGDRGWLVLSGLCLAADLAVWHWSIRFTSVANATLLGNFAAVLVPLGAWAWLGSRPTATFLAGLAAMLGGAALLVGASVELDGTRPLGDALGLLAALFYSGYIVATKRVRAGLTTATVLTWSSAVGAAALLPVAALAGERLWPATLAGWAVLAGLALCSQAAGQGLFVYALAHLPASFASVAGLLQPVTAAGFAWLLLGEPLGARQVLAGTVVLAGMALACRGSR